MNELTEDEKIFGKDQMVYCHQHLRPHSTGWCTVSVMDKVGLGLSRQETAAAFSKCRYLGLKLADDHEKVP